VGKKSRKPDRDEYTVTIKSVSAESRYLFNTICSSNHDETRAEVFARMVRAELNQTFGEGHAEYLVQRYRDYQKRLKAQDVDGPDNKL
jgi:hypothetical protein